jgi:hypothetical protein
LRQALEVQSRRAGGRIVLGEVAHQAHLLPHNHSLGAVAEGNDPRNNHRLLCLYALADSLLAERGHTRLDLRRGGLGGLETRGDTLKALEGHELGDALTHQV